MLSNIWYLMVKCYYFRYYDLFMFWKFYSFEFKYQDVVVYGWLSDCKYWKVDIFELLRRGELN